MAICIRHGGKAAKLDQRRVLDDGRNVEVLVTIIECRMCAAEDGDDGVRRIEAEDKGHSSKRRVCGNRVLSAAPRGKWPARHGRNRRSFQQRTGGEVRISPVKPRE
jgi:hypothetical protein